MRDSFARARTQRKGLTEHPLSEVKVPCIQLSLRIFSSSFPVAEYDTDMKWKKSSKRKGLFDGVTVE